MKQMTNYKRVTGYLDKIFNMLNQQYFDGTEYAKGIRTLYHL